MTSLGLVPPDIESFWFDDQWRAEYRRIAQAIVAQHSGVPEPRGASPLDSRTAKDAPPAPRRTARDQHATTRNAESRW